MFDQARVQFRSDWANLLHVDLTQSLVELAGEYADTFALRGYDSVQLASVHFLHRELPGQIRFACFDNRLNRAARVLGITTE